MLGIQIVFGLCVFVSVALGYLIPVLIHIYRREMGRSKNSPMIQAISSSCNCISAGVLMAMFFLNLLPNIRQKAEVTLRRLEISSDFPVSECVILFGYFLTLFVRQFFLMCEKKKPTAKLDRCQEIEQREGLLNEFELESMTSTSTANDEINFPSPQESNNRIADKRSPSPKLMNTTDQKYISRLYECSTGLQFITLTFACSLHAVFEGVTLALQSNIAKALHLFVAVLVHECLVAFVLGVNTTKLMFSTKVVIKFSIVFSLAVPVGIAIGLAIGKTPGPAGDVTSTLVLALASGTFLHVTFQELIPSELGNPTRYMVKIISLFSGFVFFATVTYFLVV